MLVFLYFWQFWRSVYIYLQVSRCANQIEEVCKDIEKTINQTIQNTLNSLEKDCDQIANIVEDKLQKDRYVNIEIRRVTIHQCIPFFFLLWSTNRSKFHQNDSSLIPGIAFEKKVPRCEFSTSKVVNVWFLLLSIKKQNLTMLKQLSKRNNT
jgi:hypothetical protein